MVNIMSVDRQLVDVGNQVIINHGTCIALGDPEYSKGNTDVLIFFSQFLFNGQNMIKR